jgi:hypothetical protein
MRQNKSLFLSIFDAMLWSMMELEPYFEIAATLDINGMTFKLMRYESK